MKKNKEAKPFSFTLTDDYNISLNVSAAGKSIRENKINWYSSPVDFYTLHYISEGSGNYSCENGSFDVNARDIVVIYPGQSSRLTVNKVPYVHYWINLKGVDVENLLGCTDIMRDNPVFTFDKDISEFFEKIYNNQGPEPYHQAEMLSRLYYIFAILMKNSKRSAKADSKKYHITRFTDYIQKNFSNNILIGDIAKYMGFSESQLYRLISEEFGVSPLKFLNEYRINQSKTLMKNKDLKIKSIAKMCGFSDPLYFTKAFVKHVGITPTEYRNKN